MLLVGPTGQVQQDEVKVLQMGRQVQWMGGLSVLDLDSRDRTKLEFAVFDLMHATHAGVDAKQLALTEHRLVALLAGLAMHRFERERPAS